MTQPITIHVTGHGDITAQTGERLVLALKRAGVDILHRCGGQAKCTTCRVTFQDGEPEQFTSAEHQKLSEKNLLGEARLSCQLQCAPGMTLSVLQTVQSTGLEAGKTPAEDIEPTPQWMNHAAE